MLWAFLLWPFGPKRRSVGSRLRLANQRPASFFRTEGARQDSLWATPWETEGLRGAGVSARCQNRPILSPVPLAEVARVETDRWQVMGGQDPARWRQYCQGSAKVA